MSYYLEILSETSYQKFLSQIDYDSMPFEEINELFDEAVIYDTSFAYGAGSDRLLDIINEAEPYLDEFTKEFEHDPVNEYLREKWAFAINALDSVADDEYIYFDID